MAIANNDNGRIILNKLLAKMNKQHLVVTGLNPNSIDIMLHLSIELK